MSRYVLDGKIELITGFAHGAGLPRAIAVAWQGARRRIGSPLRSIKSVTYRWGSGRTPNKRRTC